MKQWIKVPAFLAGLLVLTILLQSWFKNKDFRTEEYVRGFYTEAGTKLDGIFIGGSSVYASWQAPLAFGEAGIAVYPFSVPNMPQQAVIHVIKECRKTQPDALYILCVNQFATEELTYTNLHYIADYLPFSMEKAALISELAPQTGLSGFDSLEFYLPIIRFHSSWTTLHADDLHYQLQNLKGGDHSRQFRSKEKDVSGQYWPCDTAADLTGSDTEKTLNVLFEYFEKEQVNVLFVCLPQAREDTAEVLNGISGLVRGRGYDVLDLYNTASDLSIDFTSDFYNAKHTNIHGASKTTHAITRYLVDTYGFADKRGDPAYASWSSAADRYKELLAPYALDFELEYEDRAGELTPAAFSKAERNGDTVYLEWDPVSGAENYLLYRKYGADGPWERAASFGADEFSCETLVSNDADTSSFLIVPTKQEGGCTLYGRCLMKHAAVLEKPTI